ncbi:MAG TPA: hypothetical protein PLG14_07990 [Spirochaetales bacterium]|nr:hypothetical protein [Spirochaetales bacterium]
MEEIASTEALEREILEDSRRKSERVLKEADEESRAVQAQAEERAAKAFASLEADYAARLDRLRAESLARVPLEKARLKAAHVHARVAGLVASRLAALSAERKAALVRALALEAGAACRSRFASGAALGFRGLSPEEAARIAAEALPGVRVAAPAEDPGLPAAGLLLEAADGSLSLRATVDLLGERLLDERRGELALSLCAKAMSL